MAYIIAVAGNNGSGKTTLAHLIQRAFGFTYIPERRIEYSFLTNFFKKPKELFLETQLSFLASKAIELDAAIRENRNIVLDRSVFEDTEVYANYWLSHLAIDDDIQGLYRSLASYIIEKLPQPDLMIYCKANAKLCEDRIKRRDNRREFESFFPAEFVSDLQEIYDKWIDGVTDLPVLTVDTAFFDLQRSDTIKKVTNELEIYLTDSITTTDQLFLFNPSEAKEENFTFEILKSKSGNVAIRTIAAQRKKLAKPIIYLAAPFTSFATNQAEIDDLFSNEDYGTIDETYKTFLIDLEGYFKNLGYNTFLPHKDINNWGKTKLSSQEVFNKVVDSVRRADAIFSIPSTSIGVHLELGIAMELKKPIVLADIKNMAQSFFAKGLAAQTNVFYVLAESRNSLLDDLKKSKVSAFLRNWLREGVI
jgi:deoxyadenosine/deoxycytidine kinase